MNSHDISMIRKDLNDYGQYKFENGFQSRLYTSGDIPKWIQIQSISHPDLSFTEEFFKKEFIHQLDLLPERMIFICDRHGREIGTATAWFNDENTGRIHWVAIVPEYQGKGLSKPLITLLLNLMRKCSYTSCMLKTLPSKIIAINLYLRFGFMPSIQTDRDLKNWRSIQKAFELKNIDASKINKTINNYKNLPN